MQCNDCEKIYIADTTNKLCPECGGKGSVLVDITKEYFPNRAARRRAKNEKTEKYLPCPTCAMN